MVTSPRRSVTDTSGLTSAGCHLTRLASDLGQARQKVRLYGTFMSGYDIPIHQGNHYTCAVISMKEKIVKYYDSLVSDQTRTRVSIGESLQKSMLQVVLKYLERIHLEHKGSSLPEDWMLEPLCMAPQQNNAIDCGAFVCMFIDFIHDGCDFDFPMNEINVRDWQKNMILSIMLNKSSIDNDDDSEDEVVCMGGKMEMKFTQKSKKIVSESKWK
jgi:hypothetical protein